MPLVQVFYVSRCAPGVTSTDVRRIVGSSQLLNRRRGLTGLLSFNGSHFAQVLEGDAAQLSDLLDRIARDPRHLGMKVALRQEIHYRMFDGWDIHLLEDMGHSEDVERLLVADLPDQHFAQRLLDAISHDARWFRADTQ